MSADFTLIEGHHRVKAACKAGLGDLEVICYFHPDVESDKRKENAVVKRVKLKELLADANNRRLREWFVDDIAKHFDFGKWTPPVIRNGKAASDSRVGEMYLGVNKTLTATSPEKFLMRLRAQEPVAVAVRDVILACGFDGVTPEPEDGFIHTPAACEWVYRGGLFRRKTGDTPQALTFALTAIKATYGKNKVAVRNNFIRGFGSFAHRYPGLDAKEVARKVHAEFPESAQLLRQAQVMQDAVGGQSNKAMALVIRQAYNVNRRGGSLGSWDA